MESIIRNVSDLNAEERRLYEGVLGQKLRENQQVILQVITLRDAPETGESEAAPQAGLPAWCDVFQGLSDEQISDVEAVILDRADFTRSSQ